MGTAGVNLWEHPGRGRYHPPPEPTPPPEPEKVINMSICMWCDFHQGPYPDSDPDSVPMTMTVPKIENGVKIGVAYTVERHKCGDCVREDQVINDRKRAIAAGAHDAEEKARQAIREAWVQANDVS